MSRKMSGLHVLADDLKTSFKLAGRNILPFVLGMVGVLVVTALLLGLVFALLLIPLFIWSGGFQGIMQFFNDLQLLMEFKPSPSMMGVGLLFALPFFSPLFVSIGALFGMGREIAESDNTTVFGVFIWYRRNFLSFAGAGMMLFTVSVLAPAIPLVIIRSMWDGVTIGLVSSILIAVGFVWFAVSLGMLSMMYPAIVDGLSVSDAFRLSLKLSRNYFDRVFSTWLSFLLIILLVIVPLVMVNRDLEGPFLLSGYSFMVVVLLGLVVFPAMAVALNRVYMVLSGEEMRESSEGDYPDLRLVGDV